MTGDDTAPDLPVITDLGELVEWFGERGYPLDADTLAIACLRVGRTRAPGLVAELYWEDLLARDAAIACLGDV